MGTKVGDIMTNFDKIENLVEQYMLEEEPPTDSEQGIVKIFYSNLDMGGKKMILKAIDNEYENIDVFTDDIVRENIEESLSKKPLILLTAEEIVHKMDIEF